MFTVVVSVTYLPLSCPPQEFPDSQWHRYHPNQPVHSRDDPSRHRPAHGVHPCRAGDTLQGAPIWRLQGLHPTQGQGHVLRWGLPINTQHVPKDAGTEMAEGDFGDSHDPKWVILCNTKKGCKVWIGLMAVSCVIHIDWVHNWSLQSTSSLAWVLFHPPGNALSPDRMLFGVVFSFSFLWLEHYGITIRWPRWWLNCFAVCLSGLFMLLYEILRRYCILWSHPVCLSNACFILS